MATKTWQEEALDAIDSLASASTIGVDTETTGKEYIKDGRDYLTGISTAWYEGSEIKTFYFPFRHNEGENLPRVFLDKLKTVLNHPLKKLIFCNLKFDAHSFMTIGEDLSTWDSEFRDIRIEQHVLDENFPKGLDVMSNIYLKERKTEHLKDVAAIIGWANIPSQTMREYACQDARLTLRLHLEITGPALRKLAELENLMGEMHAYRFLLFKMEQEGVGLDTEFCAAMAERGQRRMEDLIEAIGVDPGKRNNQLKLFLEDLELPVLKVSEKTGAPSFTRDVLEEYDIILENDNNPLAKQVLEYRGWMKAVSSLYLPAIKMVSPDGRIRTNLNQTGTRTGRLSSDKPNLQQIPRESKNPWNGNAKKAFNSGDDDFVLVGYDYSQLELRLGTHYGQDPALVEEFAKADADPFRAIAYGIFGVFNPDTRQKAKTFTYARNYGAGIGKVKAQLRVTDEQVREIYANYEQSFPGLFKVSKISQERMKQRGYIKYWTGRRRRFKGDERYSKAFRAFNSLLQGGGAELVRRAQLRAPNNEECRQVLQVHDEIVFKIRKDKVEEYEPIIISAMTDFPDIKVPLAAAGKKWS